MPKYSSPEAKAAFLEKMATICEWRRDFITDLIWEVIPKSKKQYTTWAKLAVAACLYYEEHKEEMQRGDPMFLDHKDSFVTVQTIYQWKGEIRDRLAPDGRAIANAKQNGRIVGIYGTRRKTEIEDYFGFVTKIVKGSADRHNLQAEGLNKSLQMQLPNISITLALPAPTDAS